MASTRDDVAAYDDRDEARAQILRAAANAGVADHLPLILAKGMGKTIDEIANEYGVSATTFNRIYSKFVNELVKLRDTRGVKIVAPSDEGDEPLFNYGRQ